MRITGGPYSLFRRIRQNCPETYPPFPPWEWTLDRSGPHELYFTEPPDFRTLLHRATGFPYISHISSGLRWRGERYIPKNVFFLREEVLIYDAPSLPRKDSRFDQELPSIRGRKCGVKGLVQWRGLMVWSRSWFRTTGKGRERVRV